MSDKSEKSPAPAVSVVEGATAISSTSERRRANRKCVIAAVTCVVVVALIVAGALVAIKLVTDADLERLRIHRKLKSGDALIDEEYYEDRDSGNWLLKYHLTEPDRETWALNEFDKGVQNLKLQLPSGDFACYIVRQPVINGTAVATDIRVSAADVADNSEVINKISNVTNVRYKVTLLTGDVSAIIGRSGQDFCEDLQIYAADLDQTSQQEDTSTANDGRQRRQTYYWWCSDTINCGIITFRDSAFSYYGCVRECRTIFY